MTDIDESEILEDIEEMPKPKKKVEDDDDEETVEKSKPPRTPKQIEAFI